MLYQKIEMEEKRYKSKDLLSVYRAILIIKVQNNFFNPQRGNSIVFQLQNEIIQAACEFGGAIRKRREVCRIAEANKAFTRYRQRLQICKYFTVNKNFLYFYEFDDMRFYT